MRVFRNVLWLIMSFCLVFGADSLVRGTVGFGCPVLEAKTDESQDVEITLNKADQYEFDTIREKRKLLEKAESFPERLDMREKGLVTPVKSQLPFGTCWGFAAIAAAETSILGSGLAEKEGLDASSLDLSEKHLAYFASTFLDDPSSPQYGEGDHHKEGVSVTDRLDFGGTPVLATNAFASGHGPVYEAKSEAYKYKGAAGRIDKQYFDGGFNNYCYSADDDWSIDSSLRLAQSYILEESFVLPSPASEDKLGDYAYNPAGTAAIKEQLMAKRGVEIAFHADSNNPNQDLKKEGMYISKNWAHYTWRKERANHAVEIIGWDDNYPRENFIEGHQPSCDLFPDGVHEGATNGGNGAWLVKNSWGSAEEEFPNKGRGDWGLLNGQDKGVYNEETGKYEYKASQDSVHTGYFWISYYDQSLNLPEALSFDKANQESGYYLDEHDFMQVTDMMDTKLLEESKMANVFKAEVSQQLNEVSCQTVTPNTHVKYEIYILHDGFKNPEDGVLVGTMEDDYRYGGFHKKAVKVSNNIGIDKIILQRGQYYSIVVTQKTPSGDYSINMPIGYGDDGYYSTYSVGIINEDESFIMRDGKWEDYSKSQYKEEVASEIGLDNPAFDNFPIKGFCTQVLGEDYDLEMIISGDRDPYIFRDKTFSCKIKMTGGNKAEFPQGAQIKWALEKGGEELLDIEPNEEKDCSEVKLIPKAEGKTYLTASVDGIGTSVYPLTISRVGIGWCGIKKSSYTEFGKLWPYTGESIEPEVEAKANLLSSTTLEYGKEYTVEYVDNVKCGVANAVVKAAGELDLNSTRVVEFVIIPIKAEIIKLTEEPGQISVTVKDQSESGITGFVVNYC